MNDFKTFVTTKPEISQTQPQNPPFKSTPNKSVKTEDGREVWLNRAIAVVAHIVCHRHGRWKVLLTERGPKAASDIGMWALPCGYLDYDETTRNAFMREVWEECGLNLLELEKHPDIKVHYRGDVPWSIIDNPRADERQNVCFHYGFAMSVEDSFRGDALSGSTRNAEEGEIKHVAWWDVDEAMEMNLAFNHNQRIKQFYYNFLSNIDLNDFS